MEHEYFIAGCDLSVMTVVRDDVVERMTGVYCDAIKRVVKKLH